VANVFGLAGTLRPTVCSKHRAVLRPEHVGPILRFLAQAFSNRIVQDVGTLFVELEPVAQTVIKKIVLPLNAVKSFLITFPGFNHSLHPWIAWKGDNSMHMVRHQQEQHGLPFQVFMIKLDRGQDFSAYVRMTELISPAREAVDGDEKGNPAIDPMRDEMGQPFAHGQTMSGCIAEHERVGKNRSCP